MGDIFRVRTLPGGGYFVDQVNYSRRPDNQGNPTCSPCDFREFCGVTPHNLSGRIIRPNTRLSGELNSLHNRSKGIQLIDPASFHYPASEAAKVLPCAAACARNTFTSGPGMDIAHCMDSPAMENVRRNGAGWEIRDHEALPNPKQRQVLCEGCLLGVLGFIPCQTSNNPNKQSSSYTTSIGANVLERILGECLPEDFPVGLLDPARVLASVALCMRTLREQEVAIGV